MKAVILEFDRDYNAYVGDVIIEVDSWEEAEKYAKENTWSGSSYHVSRVLYDNQTFKSKRDLNNYLEKEKQLDTN